MRAARKYLAADGKAAPSRERVRRRSARAWAVLKAYGERMLTTARSEHTVISLISPADDEEALTHAQMVQVMGHVPSLIHARFLIHSRSFPPPARSQRPCCRLPTHSQRSLTFSFSSQVFWNTIGTELFVCCLQVRCLLISLLIPSDAF